MKSNLVVLSFLFFVFTVKPLLLGGAAHASFDEVLDVRGEKLRNDTDYYIVSLIRGAGGGGLTLANTRNQTCPLDIVQENLDLLRGLPATFSPVNSEEVIHVSTDLNIKFSASSVCVQSTVWKLDNYDESTGQWFVTIGGVEGNPGPQTLMNWFKIEDAGIPNAYKLVFCPSVCDSCIILCSDLGIYFENGMRSLALSENPFLVVFVKVENLKMGVSSK